MHDHHMRTLARDRADAYRAEAASHRLARQALDTTSDTDSGGRATPPARRWAARIGQLRGQLAAMRRRRAVR